MKNFKFTIQLFADEETPKSDNTDKIVELEKKIKELEDAKAIVEKERDQANNTILTMQNSNTGKEEKSDFRIRTGIKRSGIIQFKT